MMPSERKKGGVQMGGSQTTISAYTLSIILVFVTVPLGYIVGASLVELVLIFAALVLVFILIAAIYVARTRKGESSLLVTWGGMIFGLLVLLLNLGGLALAVGLGGLETQDLIPGAVLVVSGIVAIIGGLLYKPSK
jgi:hypothetical protein